MSSIKCTENKENIKTQKKFDEMTELQECDN